MSEEHLQDLLVRGLEGHSPSYREFLSRLGSYLRAFLMKRLSAMPADVEDLVQESLLAVHNKRHTFDPRQPLGPWVNAIANYKLVDFLRRHGIRESLNESLDNVGELFSHSNVEAADAQRDIMKLLDQLPERQRMPIIHTKLEGLSVEEAAEKTGMSQSSIKVGVHRGLKKLASLVSGR